MPADLSVDGQLDPRQSVANLLFTPAPRPGVHGAGAVVLTRSFSSGPMSTPSREMVAEWEISGRYPCAVPQLMPEVVLMPPARMA